MAYRDDLSAAVARAEAAERALAGVCAIHTSQPSTTECSACKRAFCDACVMMTDDVAVLCTTCYVSFTTRRRRRRLLIAAAGLAVAGGVAVSFAAMGNKRSDELVKSLPLPVSATTEKPRYRTMPNRIRVLRDSLAADACNRGNALELAKLLNQNMVFDETLAANGRFLEQCGSFSELVWTSVFAHEQRREWAEAEKLSTALIAEDPTDSDFWWWRGQDRTAQNRLAEAGADYRQSMAGGGARHAAFRFAAVAEKEGAPCEGAFAIRYYVTVEKGGEMGESWDRFKQLYAAGACDQATGHGKTVIKLRREVPLVTAKVKINDRIASVLVDSSAGYLTLAKDFSGKMALVEGTRVQTYVMGELRDGWTTELARVDLGGAYATNVPALVVESLPPGLDGVVGLSFLWRFGVDRDDEKGALTLTGWGE